MIDKLKINMKNYRCATCGRYIKPDEEFYGEADRDDGEPIQIYCDEVCCDKSESKIKKEGNNL